MAHLTALDLRQISNSSRKMSDGTTSPPDETKAERSRTDPSPVRATMFGIMPHFGHLAGNPRPGPSDA